MFGPSSPAARQLTKRVALGVVASPALVVAYLFVVNPEALGSPAIKLLLMTLAGCLLMAMGELSDALAKWALARLESRPSVLDAFRGATLTAAPESTRFG